MNCNIHWTILHCSMTLSHSKRCKTGLVCSLSHCCTVFMCKAVTFYWPAWKPITSCLNWTRCNTFLQSDALVNGKITQTIITALVVIVKATVLTMTIQVRVSSIWTMTWWAIPHLTQMELIIMTTLTTIIIIMKTVRNMWPTFTH